MLNVNTPSKSQNPVSLPLPLGQGEWEAKPSKPQARADRGPRPNPVWPKLRGSFIESEEPRETLRLIHADGQAITIQYSDIRYTQFVSKERIVLLMRNDDDFSLVGRNLHLLLYDLENRRLFVLSECQPSECGPDEVAITSISSVVFADMPKPVAPKTAAAVSGDRKAQVRF